MLGRTGDQRGHDRTGADGTGQGGTQGNVPFPNCSWGGAGIPSSKVAPVEPVGSVPSVWSSHATLDSLTVQRPGTKIQLAACSKIKRANFPL